MLFFSGLRFVFALFISRKVAREERERENERRESGKRRDERRERENERREKERKENFKRREEPRERKEKELSSRDERETSGIPLWFWSSSSAVSKLLISQCSTPSGTPGSFCSSFLSLFFAPTTTTLPSRQSSIGSDKEKEQ